jgi:hypothetical protein
MSRVQELTLKLLDAELTPAEERELQGLVTGERAAREHIALLELEAALRAEREIDFTEETLARIQRIAGDATQKNVMNKIKARSSPVWKATTSGPRKAVSQRSANSTSQPRISVRRVRREKQSPFAIVALAASVAVVLLLAILYSQKPPGTQPTAHALAVLQSAPSGTTLTRNGSPIKTQAEEKILDGDKLEAASGAAVVRYEDGTLVTLEPGATLAFSMPEADAGKMLRLSNGAIKASVAKQPLESPMVIRGKHATVTVLGTQFTLASTSEATRLDVSEGLVGMRRDSDGRSILVKAGEFAIASDGNDLLAQRVGAPPPPVKPIDPLPPPPAAQPKGEMAVTGFHLVDATTGKVIQGYSPLAESAKLELAKLPHFSLIAITEPAEVGSIVFDFDGRKKMRLEASAPYAITTNWDQVRYMPWTLAPGPHTLTATPYASKDGRGKAGKPLTINFTVVPK